MKVILNSDVTNLGEEGDICTVAPGYARNFLLPKGLVMEYSERNLASIEERRSEIEARREQKRKDAASVKERLEAEALVISMTAGINGKLFGSVTNATIAEQLAAQGIEVERKRIDVPEHSLKAVGTYKVRVKLYADEEALLVVQVVASNAQELEEKRSRLAGAAGQMKPSKEETPEAAEGSADAPEGDQESDQTSLDPEVIAMQQALEEEAAQEDADRSSPE
ncbi:large subunit ribosomal protein L9 [Alkalispirochaeta americana]|uniref:Large ribosomal subunit protein bL9 n=1 Tax=Alkalispirochaeta americana TaxID=159291 RepID=A0A1N6PSF6_9SPIO|nr:50S ribosomal protein L9 [Alkalispirochaeta americana]SIQ07247.1 large subunit ribosomal protein L9 [Alkalispirochaeta americana]